MIWIHHHIVVVTYWRASEGETERERDGVINHKDGAAHWTAAAAAAASNSQQQCQLTSKSQIINNGVDSLHFTIKWDTKCSTKKNNNILEEWCAVVVVVPCLALHHDIVTRTDQCYKLIFRSFTVYDRLRSEYSASEFETEFGLGCRRQLLSSYSSRS